MRKSALIFGLLASSLVMLMIMPFLNQNNSFFNSAMAQEYNNYDDNKYSQYPTKENKYECRTGPFEGFFVDSVEFCKLKFDDRKNHTREIKQEYKALQAHQVYKAPQVFKAHQVLMEPMVSMAPMELMVQKLILVSHVYLML